VRVLLGLIAAGSCLWAVGAQAGVADPVGGDAVGVVVVGGSATETGQELVVDPLALEGPAAAPAIGEHPVYRLRPEPYADGEAMLVTLDDLLGMALANNFGLQQQNFSIEKGHYTVDQTYFAYDPQLGASLNYADGSSTGASNNKSISGRFSWSKPLEYGDAFDFSYSANNQIDPSLAAGRYSSSMSLGYTRPLARGAGRYLHRIPRYIASNNLALSYERMDDEVQQLKKSILDTFYSAVAARESINVRQNSLERSLKQLERAVERYKAGLGIQADVLQSENSVLTQRTQLVSAQADYRSILDQLTNIVGLPQEFELKVDIQGSLMDLGSELPEDLWDLLLKTNYELKSLNTQLANLRLNRDQQSNLLRPNLGLSLSLGTSKSGRGAEALSAVDSNSYQVGVNWSGKPGERDTKAQLAQTDIDIASLELSLKEAELKLKSTLRAEERDLNTKHDQIALSQSNLTVVMQTYEIMVERNAVGLATTLDVIEAQEAVLNTELALLQSKVAYGQAYRAIQLSAGLL
jgi:outer membrane protein TolC